MLDALLARLFGPALDAVGRRFGRGAAALALFAFVLGLAALPLIAFRHYWPALAVFVAGRIVSAVAARAADGNAAGPVMDAVSFAALPFAFALADPSRALAAVFVMFALSAQSAAALRFGRGLIADTELLIAFAVPCVFPAQFPAVAYILGVLCFVSAGVQVAAPRRFS
jgi:hypothetical protein